MRISDWSSDVCSSDLAVVDQLETVQVEVQHGEAGALPAVHARDRRVQALEHDNPVGQAGQAVVAGLVGEFLLRAHALADLRAQLAVGAFQLARPRLDAELELRSEEHTSELQSLMRIS